MLARLLRIARPTYQPHLECLEARCLPNATVFQSGNVITIRGDNKNDTLVITDNGGVGAGALIIQGTVSGQTQSLAVTPGLGIFVNIYTNGGRDNVIYNVTGGVNTNTRVNRPTSGRFVLANLGAGNDAFRFAAVDDTVFTALSGSLVPMAVGNEATVSVTVNGGGGNDNISMRYFGLLGGLNGVSTRPGALGGTDQGNINFVASGGTGKDSIFVNVGIHTQTQGRIQAIVNGNGADDNLGLTTDIPLLTAVTTTALVDGGPGSNGEVVSQRVLVSNVQNVNVL